jgi:hypothetical protein
LLEPMRAQFTLGSEKMSLGGFQAVDRQKLKALSGETLAQLAASDELELVYLHLQSMRNFALVKDRLIGTRPAPGAPQAEEEAHAAADPAGSVPAQAAAAAA